MRIHTDYRIEPAADPGQEHRPLLAHISIERIADASHHFPMPSPGGKAPSPGVYNGVAVAADGFILAVVPVSLDDTDATGLIYCNSLAHARKWQMLFPGILPNYLTLRLDAETIRSSRADFPRFGLTRPGMEAITAATPWITWRALVRDIVARERETLPAAGLTEAGTWERHLNTTLLAKLGSAIGTETPRITHAGEGLAYLIEPHMSQRARGSWPRPPFGLLMPLTAGPDRRLMLAEDLAAPSPVTLTATAVSAEDAGLIGGG